MYTPKYFEETNPEVLHELINEYPFASIICTFNKECEVNHLPLILNKCKTQLHGHIAKNNPITKLVEKDPNTSVIVIFQGPNSYISPSWYPSKHVSGKVVPTWNYAIVHIAGKLNLTYDLEWIRTHVSELTDRHEQQNTPKWKLDDAPSDYIQTMLQGIVGISIEIDNIHGKFKLSQNRSAEDRNEVIKQLSKSNQESSKALFKLMHRNQTR